jgi:hypothetical protein
MAPGLLLPRILTALIGAPLVLLGAFILLTVFGAPANDPTGRPGGTDAAAGALLVVLPLVLIVIAARARSARAAWLCAGALALFMVAGFSVLFV